MTSFRVSDFRIYNLESEALGVVLGLTVTTSVTLGKCLHYSELNSPM